MARRPASDGPPVVQSVPIGDLRPNPRNPNVHPEEQINRLMASLRRDGQTRPVLARKANMQLIAGHAVTTAARRLQWTEINAVLWDVDQATADRVMLGDERLGELSHLDGRRVADLMREISEGDWLATGYNVEEANQILEHTDAADLEVYEIATATVTDDFWISVRGPLPMQAEVLQRMKELLGQYPNLAISLDTVEDA